MWMIICVFWDFKGKCVLMMVKVEYVKDDVIGVMKWMLSMFGC